MNHSATSRRCFAATLLALAAAAPLAQADPNTPPPAASGQNAGDAAAGQAGQVATDQANRQKDRVTSDVENRAQDKVDNTVDSAVDNVLGKVFGR